MLKIALPTYPNTSPEYDYERDLFYSSNGKRGTTIAYGMLENVPIIIIDMRKHLFYIFKLWLKDIYKAIIKI